MKILVIDVGGTHVKVSATGHNSVRKVASGPKMTAAQMVHAVKELASDWTYDVVSIGYPGPVLHNRIVQEPHNLGAGWVGFDFSAALGRPTQIINDAEMQALGSYAGGSMLFLGLGAGLGSAMIVDGAVGPLELAHLPYYDGYTYEDCVGMRGLQRLGVEEWRECVADVIERLKCAMLADDVVIGGGNARLLHLPLPAGARLGNNDNAFLGGFALWETSRKPAAPAPARSADVLRAAARHDGVVFLDVDNTLLDHDRVIEDLEQHLQREVGRDAARQYFELFQALRSELGYADYLGALQRFRVANPHEPGVLAVASFLLDYPFANRLFPGSLDVIEYLRALGPTVILSDGDVVFQPRKVERAGLFRAVEGRVLIYVHKQKQLDAAALRYPADHYLVIDDKLRTLAAVKQHWASKVTTIFPQQGHYARSPEILAKYPPADVTIARISDLLQYDLRDLVEAGRAHAAI